MHLTAVYTDIKPVCLRGILNSQDCLILRENGLDAVLAPKSIITLFIEVAFVLFFCGSIVKPQPPKAVQR